MKTLLPACLLPLALGGCVLTPSDPPPRDTVAAAVRTGLSAPLGPATAPGQQVDEARRQRLAELLARPLDASAAIEVAALADHEILALLAGLDADRAATAQAGLLPNPLLRLMVLRPESGSGGDTMLDYGLMQDLVETLTRGRRLAIAEAAERAQVYRTAETVLLRLWAAEAAWVGGVAARERSDLWARRGALAGERAALADALAGRGVTDQGRATEQRARAAALLQAARQSADDAQVARARLAEALGLDSAQRVGLPATLPMPTWAMESPEELRAAARRLRLTVLEAQATALRDRETLALVERWRYLPRLGIGLAGERQADGMDAFGVEIAATLPLFDQGQARLAGARAAQAASAAQLEARQNRVQAGVERALAEWQREQQRDRLLASEVEPALARVLALREQSYRDGLADRFAVLDAADALLELALDRLAARESLWLARIELARQTGSAAPAAEPAVSAVRTPAAAAP